MPARLVSLDGAPDIPLDRPVMLVGRHPCCNVPIESPRVSRLHCCLSRHGDEFEVRDLWSSNGTRINGLRAESGRLREGDELSIAYLRYRLEINAREKRPTSPDHPSNSHVLAIPQGADTPALEHLRMALVTIVMAFRVRRRKSKALPSWVPKKNLRPLAHFRAAF